MTALGRGLGSLIPNTPAQEEIPRNLPIARIRPNPNQPRKVFVTEALDSLKESIQCHGVMQPICVRAVDGSYEIIAGERRWRAARLSGLTEIPVIIRDADEALVLELALIENIQREDLDAIEKAKGFKEMMDKVGLTQEEVAQRVGVSRAAVANHLRLLQLASEVQEALVNGLVSFGHARALAGFEGHKDQCAALETIVRGELSVRATEQLVRGDVPASGGVTKPSSGDAPKAPKVSPEVPTWQVDFKRRIEEGLGLAAELRCSDSYEGQVLLKFNDRRQLEHLMERLAPAKRL
jgi:ParB family chromosome partitioning protein